MLQVSSLVYDFFELVLTNLTEFLLDYIEENPEISETMSKKDLEFLSRNEYGGIALNLLLMLLLMI